MPLYYDDDQTMLADTAGQFMAEEGSIKNQLRHWRDRQCKDGFGHALWRQFAEMGFTGMLVDAAGLRALAARVTPSATLLVDEAYNELADDPAGKSVVDLVRMGHDVIVCRTFSKIYGMAGMRVGYALTSEENAQRIRGHMMSFGGNTCGLAAAIASYDDTGFLDASRAAILEGRQMILDAAARSGCTALPSQTNFVYIEVPDADAVQAAMEQRGILIRPAYGQWTQYSRVSTGKIEDVARYAAALPEVIDEVGSA